MALPPFDREYVQLRIIGHFGSSTLKSDQWSTGLKLAHIAGTAIGSKDFTTFIESISAPIATFHGALANGTGLTTYLDELTAAPFGTDRKQPKTVVTTRRLYTTPVAGNGSGAQLPW